MEDRERYCVIEKITNPDIFIDHYQWIKECGFIEIPAHLVLARAIAGEYCGYLGKIDGVDAGIAIVKRYGDMAFIVCAWCKNNFRTFIQNFIETLKGEGFIKFRTSSYHNPEAYERLTGFKRLWSVYEGEL